MNLLWRVAHRILTRSISVLLMLLWFPLSPVQAEDAPVLTETVVDVESLDLQFKKAMGLRTDGDLYGAITALNNVLISAPRMNRARLELAVAYYRAARYEQAVAQARQVLDDPTTPAEVRETVALFLEQINSVKQADDERRHTFSGSYGVGAGHDTNINAGPGQDLFPVSGFELRIDDGEERQSDAYINAALSVEHSYRMPGSLGIGSRPVQMLWQSEMGFYRKEYQDEHPYTVDVINFSTGPAFISRTDWRAKVNFGVDWVRLGDNSLAVYTSLSPSYTKVRGAHEFTVNLLWLYREFMPVIHENREGHRYGTSLDYGYRFTPTVSGQVGVGGYRQNARVDVEEFDVVEVYFGGYWSAWEGGAVFSRMSYEESDYKGREPLYDKGRFEREHRAMVGASHAIRSGWFAGWVLDSRLTYTDTHANIDLYRFLRKEFSIDINRSF